MTMPGGLLDTIGARLFPGKAQDGLISEEDLAQARKMGLLQLGAGLLSASGPSTQRVGFGQALGQSLQGAQKGYQETLDNMIERRGKAASLDQLKMKNAQVQRAQAARAKILTDYPMPDASDPDGLRKWIDQTLPLWLDGDPEMAGKLAEVRKSIEPKEHNLQTTNLGDRTLWTDPRTGTTVREEKNAVSPSTLMRFGEMTPAAQQNVISATQTAFDRETKDYAKASEAWAQVNHVLQRARTGTPGPDDIVQIIDGISRLNNPGAVVRTGTVQLQLQKIGSWADKLRMWAQRGGQGAWPTDIVEGIARSAREIAKEHSSQYGKIRKRAIYRAEQAGIPYMDGVLPNVWEASLEDNGTPGVPQARPGESIQQYIDRTRGGK